MPTTTFGPDRRRAGPIAGQPDAPAPEPGVPSSRPGPRSPLPVPAPHDPAHASVRRAPRVDASERGSVSLLANDAEPGQDPRPTPSKRGGHKGHGIVAVGPGLAGPVLLGAPIGLFGMNPLPVTGAKIHPPLLRSDVLSRDRLNRWLDDAVTGRLALIVAEAGFGKTTLLADWARQTSRLTAWYRLEPDDRDWLTFVRHLVGSGRELDPAFAPETYGLLMQLGPGGPTQAELVDSLVRELAEFGGAHPQGFTLMFDDYHVIDRSEETEPIVRAILDHTGPGFSVIIASRTTPRLPLSRLRARGGVARLDGDALCFDVPEAERLFRDAYHQPLDPDVITDLIDRTEGWPALLSLVHASVARADASQIGSLIGDLSGAVGDVYDYLAVEVVDRLPPELADFMVHVSILDEVDVESAGIVTSSTEAEIQALLSEAESLGLMSQQDVGAGFRIVPLVREFLLARLSTVIGRDALRKTHLTIAEHYAATGWRTAATHYERAGRSTEAAVVIERSLDQILGAGLYRAAVDILSASPNDGIVVEILRSRLALQIGAPHEALTAALSAVKTAESSATTNFVSALMNATSIAIGAREFEEAFALAQQAHAISHSAADRELAAMYLDLLSSSATTHLPGFATRLERLLSKQLRREQWHYAAITSLNLAQVLVWLDRAEDSLSAAAEAERLFKKSSQGYEAVTVRLVQAHARAHLGQWQRAEPLLTAALGTVHPEAHLEAVLEAASLASWYGPYDLPEQILTMVRRDRLPQSWAQHWKALDLWLATDSTSREAIVHELPPEPPRSMEVGAAFRWHLTTARAALAMGDDPDFRLSLARAEQVAAAQASPAQERLVTLLRCIGDGPRFASSLLSGWPPSADPMLGVFAQELGAMLGSLSDTALGVVLRAAEGQPHRWLSPLRDQLADPRSPTSQQAATLLERIGEPGDILRLRDFSRRAKRSGQAWGYQLIERLAPRVRIDDLGLMKLQVGQRTIDGRDVRRRVLALVAFLATQGGSATPDQVLDALWPDLDPEQGSNSLHQTVYFLRRVIDPDYRAGYTAEYLHFDGDVIWLDRVLVDCRSWQCRRLLAQRPETPELVEDVLGTYAGKFAPEFAYEDWTAPYRDTLHAGVLSIMERAVSGNIGSPDLHWRLWVGQQVLSLDPEADAIEAQVIRLYRAIGAQAAAAEQYAHYSTLLRDQLGVDPPRIEDV